MAVLGRTDGRRAAAGISGRQQNLERGVDRKRLIRDLKTVQATGHHHIRQDQINPVITANNLKRGGSVLGGQGLIAQIFQTGLREPPDPRVILNHQNGLVSRFRNGTFTGVRNRRSPLAGGRKIERDRRAHPLFAVNRHMAARLLCKTVDHAQAKPRPSADTLGGEKRLERAGHHLGFHAGAGVGDRQGDIVTGFDIDLRGSVIPVQRHVLGLNRQDAAVGHRITGVDGEVQNGVFDLTGVGQRQFQIVGQIGFDRYVIPQRPFQKRLDRSHQIIERHSFRFKRLLAGKRQQLRGQLCAKVRGFQRLSQQVLLREITQVHLEQFQIADDHCQQVVEIMGKATGKLPDGLHFLGPMQGVAAFHVLCQIMQDTGKVPFAVNPPFGNGEPDRHLGAILAARVHLAADPNDLFFSGCLVASYVVVVLMLVRFRHQHLDVLANHLCRRIPQNGFSRRAVARHDALIINRDNRLRGGIQDRPQARLAFFKAMLDLKPLGGILQNHENEITTARAVFHLAGVDHHRPGPFALDVDDDLMPFDCRFLGENAFQKLAQGRLIQLAVLQGKQGLAFGVFRCCLKCP